MTLASDSQGNTGTGSIVSYIDTESVDTILQTAFPLFLYYGVKNQTYEVDASYSFLGLFDFSFKSIHFNEAYVGREKHFGFSEHLPEISGDDFENDAQYLLKENAKEGIDGELVFKIGSISFDADM